MKKQSYLPLQMSSQHLDPLSPFQIGSPLCNNNNEEKKKIMKKFEVYVPLSRIKKMKVFEKHVSTPLRHLHATLEAHEAHEDSQSSKEENNEQHKVIQKNISKKSNKIHTQINKPYLLTHYVCVMRYACTLPKIFFDA
jgi:hypothetical protein